MAKRCQFNSSRSNASVVAAALQIFELTAGIYESAASGAAPGEDGRSRSARYALFPPQRQALPGVSRCPG